MAVPQALSPWEEEILRHLGPKVVVLGIGNRERGDDGAGSIIAEELAGRGVPRVFDCGGLPENFVVRVAAINPSDILFVDAVDFGAPPGSIEFFESESLGVQSASTHSAGLSPVMTFLTQSCRASCWLLAVQPEQLTWGEGPSQPVAEAVEAVISSVVWHVLANDG